VKERRKRLTGHVLSDKMAKTVVVEVERLARHPRYGKVLRMRKKYKAHDEGNDCRVGDLVRIVESRPLSREKRWRVEEIVRRAEEIPEVALEVLEVEQ
jgi:small subunit ribosomal protein S17